MIVLTTSLSYEQHVRRCLADVEEVSVARSLKGLPVPRRDRADVVLVHVQSFPGSLGDSLIPRIVGGPAMVVAASDVPELAEFLRLSGAGVRAYLNSYMADVHYAQMLDMVRSGQSWVVPSILDEALAVARNGQASMGNPASLELLTPRQRDVALDVAGGLSNQQIAQKCGIAEPTVKVHLGRIFKKLNVKNRFELALKLQGLREAS